MKLLIGVPLAAADVIVIWALLLSAQAHQVHGNVLALYIAAIVASVVVWTVLLKGKPPKASGTRSGYPYGGGQR